MPERVLICGDRHWDDYETIAMIVHSLPNDAVVIHGDAHGADTLAGQAAKKRGLKVQAFPADWRTYGPAAGPIRNKQMLKRGKPHRVIAFHRNIGGSKGTKNMVSIASKAGIPVEVIE